MRNITIAITILLSSCVNPGHMVVDPKGDFATIDVEKSNRTFKQLLKDDAISIQSALRNPGEYNPSVFYALASALFETGKRDESLPWFYFAQLRAKSDAAKSLDLGAREGVTLLNHRFGLKINQYAFRNLRKLKAAVALATKMDVQIPRNYDARWIALHGMDAFDKTKLRFEPKERWNGINQRIRQENLKAFEATVAHLGNG